MNGHRLTLNRAARLLASQRLSSEELSIYCHRLALLGEEEWNLNAFTQVLPRGEIVAQAQASDERISRGKRLSPLDGIPVTFKANISVRERPLTAASKILGEGDGSLDACGCDSDVAELLLRRCGAVLVGITNMDEFGMGSLGTNCSSRFSENAGEVGQTFTKNPLPFMQLCMTGKQQLCDEIWVERIRAPEGLFKHHHLTEGCEILNNLTVSAGGSSCGSAASVSHGSSLASIGTDTGGSVRLPAAWCGVVGLKPTYGLVSRHGVVSYASSLDTVGVLAPTANCAAAVLHCIANRSDDASRDSTSVYYSPSVSLLHVSDQKQDELAVVETGTGDSGEKDTQTSSLSASSAVSKDLSGLRVGIPSAFSVAECPGYVKHAWALGADALQRHGAEIVTIPSDVISPMAVQNSLAAYYVLASAEASSNLSRYDGIRYGMRMHSVGLDGLSEDEGDGVEKSLFSNMTPLEGQLSAMRVNGFGVEVRRRILCGTSVLSSDRFHTYYEAAARLRAMVVREFQGVFDRNLNANAVDLMLVPTALSLPCPIGKDGQQPDSTEMFANDVMTVPISLAGLPSVSVPVGIPTNDVSFMGVHTVGIQVVGGRLTEGYVLRAASVVEGAR